MKKTKTYINGQPEIAGQHTAAREVLVKAGIYGRLGNFGPFFHNKFSRRFSIVETIVRGGYEFTIVETEVMSFSLDSLSVSRPRKQLEAWFQPINC